MARAKLKDLREKSDEDLVEQLSELKSELAKLRIDAAKGTLRKDAGKVRYYRRDIARILTILRERGKKL
ncbi:MAG: 50S ribosomal protein L29 [Candidatus Nitrosocaldaceae archaeon]|nr:MAG: 50S ribosomal protein L29 [Candidatus Nitrosocaldaceae archaeon]